MSLFLEEKPSQVFGKAPNTATAVMADTKMKLVFGSHFVIMIKGKRLMPKKQDTKQPTEHTWIPVAETQLAGSSIIRVIERLCNSSDDSRLHKFYLLRSSDWSNIIPITEDGKVVMVKQYRVGIDDFTLEVPGGVTDSTDETAMAGALRELAEETGYVPVPGAKCVNLGTSLPNPAIQNNRCHSFVVGPVRRERNQQLDSGEMIEVIEIPIREIPERIRCGEISHALMLNTFFYLALASKEGSDSLLRELQSFTLINDAVK